MHFYLVNVLGVFQKASLMHFSTKNCFRTFDEFPLAFDNFITKSSLFVIFQDQQISFSNFVFFHKSVSLHFDFGNFQFMNFAKQLKNFRFLFGADAFGKFLKISEQNMKIGECFLINKKYLVSL